MDRDKENQLIMIATQWEAMCDLLDGKKVDDFMLSFPAVKKLQDRLSCQSIIERSSSDER